MRKLYSDPRNGAILTKLRRENMFCRNDLAARMVARCTAEIHVRMGSSIQVDGYDIS